MRLPTLLRQPLWLVVLLFVTCLPTYAAVQARDIDPQYTALLDEWSNAPANSAEETQAFDRLAVYVEARLGLTAINAYRSYMDAPVDSPEETQALEVARREIEARNVDWQEAQTILGEYLLVAEVHEGYSDVEFSTDSEFDRLFDAWLDTPVGSQEEAAAMESLTSYVNDRLGTRAIEAYRDYLDAPVGSEEEQRALDRIAAEAQARDISVDEASDILAGYFMGVTLASDPYTSVEDIDPSKVEVPAVTKLPPVEVELTQPDIRASGEMYVTADIHNHSPTDRVWITSDYTTLRVSPSLDPGGQAIEIASLPGSKDENTLESGVARIDPGQRMKVSWSRDFDWDSISLLGELLSFFSQYRAFRSEGHWVEAQVVIWDRPPTDNPGDGFQRRRQVDFTLEPPLQLSILGACIGALLAFFLQSLNDLRKSEQPGYKAVLQRLALGSISAILLAIVIILLNEYLAGKELINVEIKDFGGAIAAGALIQLLGYAYFSKLLPSIDSAGSDS